MKTATIRQCEVCQSDFKAHQYSIRNGHARYCSLECKGLSAAGKRRGGSYRKCFICSAEFYAKPNRIKQGWAKYCSQACKSKSTVFRDKLSNANSGKVRTPDMRMKVSESKLTSPLTRRGASNPAWKGGVTPVNQLIRHSAEYRFWREAVFARDDFTCQDCGDRGGSLNADHIQPFSLFPELRLDLDNGRTLCVPCHKNTPTYGSKSKLIHAKN